MVVRVGHMLGLAVLLSFSAIVLVGMDAGSVQARADEEWTLRVDVLETAVDELRVEVERLHGMLEENHVQMRQMRQTLDEASAGIAANVDWIERFSRQRSWTLQEWSQEMVHLQDSLASINEILLQAMSDDPDVRAVRPAAVEDAAAVVVEEGMEIVLTRAYRDGGKVIVDLAVRALDVDRDVRIGSTSVRPPDPSRVFDHAGIQHNATHFHLGSSSGSNGVMGTYLAGISTPVSVHFEGVPDATGVLALVDINFEVVQPSRANFRAAFRDIPLTAR